jgi:uncharacterized damage-inducible protein DinB
MSSTVSALSTADLLAHWQGHRRLTRRVIEAFPEESLHSFSVGGMRPFAALAAEMLAIAVPMLREIVSGEAATYTEAVPASSSALLAAWDAATPELDAWFARIRPEQFAETQTVFGQFTGPVWSHVAYAIDNEVHHRAQGYVYLRALGTEPPAFWQRD